MSGIHLWDAQSLYDVKSIIFDCDGVLIDIRKSYDLTIRKTVSHFARMEGVQNPPPVTAQIIEEFKATGGFNDEVDLAYAAILSMVEAARRGEDPSELLDKVIDAADETGIVSVEKYLGEGIAPLRTRLGFPGDEESALRTIFNQIFYGPQIFKELYGKISEFAGPGMIENDRLILDSKLASYLKERFAGRAALVTGRGIESARRSLGHLLEGFDLKNSFFLEDHPRSMAKPNPEPLERAIASLGAEPCLYVGDSFEDLLMARRVAKAGRRVLFCGIIGTSEDPQKRLGLFQERGAHLALDSIALLPKVLNPQS